jgi:hypothetical protein
MYVYLSLAILFVLYGCRQPATAPVGKTSQMDSMVAVYISEMDSLEFKEPSLYTYRVLKAYYAGDTAFFQQMQKQRDKEAQYLYPVEKGNCPEIPRLSTMHADEAYRFIHGQSFCNFIEVVTVYKRSDSLLLQYIVYIPPAIEKPMVTIRMPDGTVYKVGDTCIIRKKTQHTIKKKEWDALKEALENTDFWGLKAADQRILLDGSYWNIQAVIKEPRYIDEQRTHSVTRNSPVLKEFRDLGTLFLQLSGEKPVCGSLD